MRKAPLVCLPFAIFFASACGPSSTGNGTGDDDGSGGPPDAGYHNPFIDSGPNNEFTDAGMAAGACDKIDILFVLDNSGSMGEEQTNLATNFPMFAQIIDTYMNSIGQTLDYHVAITTTDRNFTENDDLGIPGFPPIPTQHMGHDGQFQTNAGDGTACNFPSGRRYLQRGDNVDTILPCVAKVGTSGDSSEMPLETMKLALVDRVQDGYNAGFLRDDALLAVVILTDENDCSVPGNPVTVTGTADICAQAAPIAPYLTVLDNLKGGERGRWAVAAITGPPPNTCMSNFGSAEAGVRLNDFVTQTGANGILTSICDGNLAVSLQNAFNTFSQACESFPPVGKTAPGQTAGTVSSR
jgi:hypothetical protein